MIFQGQFSVDHDYAWYMSETYSLICDFGQILDCRYVNLVEMIHHEFLKRLPKMLIQIVFDTGMYHMTSIYDKKHL